MADHRETIITRILSYDADSTATHLGVPLTDPQVQQRMRNLRGQYQMMSIENLRCIEQDYLSRREEAILTEHKRNRHSRLRKNAAIAAAMLGAGVAGDIAGIDKMGGLENTVITLCEVVGAIGLVVNGVKLYFARQDCYR